jgi:hypothetical protein
LPALYPYATQPDGEWAFQGTFTYNFKRKTVLGGKYGTIIKVNASHIRGIDKKYTVPDYAPGSSLSLKGTEGYTSSFFKMGKELYYQDINLSIDKKLTGDFKLNLMYMNQQYNPKVVRNEPEDIITSNIFILEGKYNINKKMTLRTEAQYLQASKYTGPPLDDVSKLNRVNQGNWICGVVELSVLPYFMFTVSDMYNSGITGEHYYKALISYTWQSHFVQVGYGRTRAGRDCSGGVCRDVPASKGFSLSYNYNF